MRTATCLLLFVLAVAPPLHAQSLAAADGPPAVPDRPGSLLEDLSCPRPSSMATGAIQVILGFGTGTAAILSGVMGAFMLEGMLGAHDLNLTRAAWDLGYVSYVLGSTAGVYGVGNARGHEGRFWPTLLGSALGFGAPGATVAYHLSDPTRRACALPAPLSAPPAPLAPPAEPQRPPRAGIVLFQLSF